MSSEPTRNEATPGAPSSPLDGAEGATLDQVVIALQKTFSRVSASTARVASHRARAIVTGRVGFSMRLEVAMPQADHLVATPGGPIVLELNGTLDTDVRVQATEAPEA